MSLLADGYIAYFWDLRASKVHANGSDGASWTGLQCGMREYTYRVDGEGRIFHDGSEIVDAATLRFFLLALQRTPEGRWLALCQGERNWFEAADTPFVIQRLTLRVTDGRLDGAGPLPGRRLSRGARSRHSRAEWGPPLLPGAQGIVHGTLRARRPAAAGPVARRGRPGSRPRDGRPPLPAQRRARHCFADRVKRATRNSR